MSDPTKRKRLYAALQTKVGLTMGEEDDGPKQLRVLFRLPEAQMRQWLVVMHHLFTHEQQASWSLDISKKYFLLSGRTVQGWRIIIRDDNLDKALDSITSVVGSSPNARFQLDQVPLMGRHGGDRNAINARGKGARAITGDAGTPPIATMVQPR